VAYDHLIDAYQRVGLMTKARQRAEEAAEKLPGDKSAGWLLGVLYAAGRLDEAEAFARRALQRHPDSVALPVWLATLPGLRGDWAAAEAALAQLASTAEPRLRAAAQRALARAFIYRGRYRDAEALLVRTAEEFHSPADHDELARDLAVRALMIGWGTQDAARLEALERERGKYAVEDDATGWEFSMAWMLRGDAARWRASVRLYPSMEDYTRRYLRALALRDAGRPEAALADLKALSDRQGISALPLLERASLALARNRPDVALEAAQMLRDNRMDLAEEVEASLRAFYYPRSLYLLGRAFEAKGDVARAAAHYQAFLALWREADPELPLLRDARERLAALPR